MALIRRAEINDVDILVEICRAIFTKVTIWQVPRFMAKRRWLSILSSSVTETWLCVSNGQVQGFVLLILDMKKYLREKQEQSGGLLLRVYSHISCPKLSLSKVLSKILKLLNRLEEPVAVLKSQVISKRPIWIEPIAVMPQMRRKGLAQELLEHSRKRAVDLGSDAVKLAAEICDKPAISLYEKVGFVPTSNGKYSLVIYTMKVSSEKTEERKKA